MAEITKATCEELDHKDPLAGFRERFSIPQDMTYLDGNSLGACPRHAMQRAREVVENEWAGELIESWNNAGWFRLPGTLGDKIARLIGAGPGEVVVTDATGINLYKILSMATSLRKERRVIVMEGDNFPTNNYVAQGLVAQLGDKHEIRFVTHDGIMDAIDDDVGVVCLTHAHYKTGRILDMAAITGRAQELGALAVWDLCHSAGAMPVDLNGCNADFAVGCTYKYLNGGPGSPAFVFSAARHHDAAMQPLTGWWGHAAPFAFERDYRPAEGITQLLSGTQPVLSLAVCEAGIDIFLEADMQQLRAKSMALTGLFIELLDQRCGEYGFTLVSPREASQRGSQVSIGHEQGYPIMRALIENRVIGDFRAPGNLRFGFTPLYTRYVDVWRAVDVLTEIMASGVWKEARFNQRTEVT